MSKALAVLATSAILAAFAYPASAQLRFTPVFGYYHPAKSLGTVQITDASGTPAGAFTISRTSGPLIGLRVGSTFGESRFGWEAAILRTFNELELDFPPTFNTLGWQRNTVTRHETPISFRLVAHLESPNSAIRFRLFAGPAIVAAGTDWLRPDDAEWSAVVGGGMEFDLNPRLGLTADLEDYSYTAHRNRWQNDVALSVGFRFRSR